jgi:hypothetical protein
LGRQHSHGYYYAHVNASILWAPDFNKGFVSNDIVNRIDMAPTIARILGVENTVTKGHLRPQLFASHVGPLPACELLLEPVDERPDS